MTDDDWNTGYAKALGVFLNGDAISEPDPRGERVRDDTFLLLFSADSQPVTFTLPARFGRGWTVVLDTGAAARPRGPAPPRRSPATGYRTRRCPGPRRRSRPSWPREHQARSTVMLAGRSMMVLRRIDDPAAAG